jgi:hypothetical protein
VTLKEILDKLAIPGSLTDHPILHSWIVEEYLEENPKGANYPAEFLIGKALERHLRLWSEEIQLDKRHVKAWKQIFCLKACYFQERLGLNAYLERPTLDVLGAILIDKRKLVRLVPGRESEADDLPDDPDPKDFWKAFERDKALAALPHSTTDGILKRGLKHLAERIETRRQQKYPEPAAVEVRRSVEARTSQAEKHEPAVTAPTSDLSLTPQSGDISQTIPVQAEPVVHSSADLHPEARGEHVMLPVSPKEDPALLYTSRVFPPRLAFVPQEWADAINSAAAADHVFVRGIAGSGKTHLLYAIADRLLSQNLLPLYIHLPEYVPFAAETDILRFAAVYGDFGRVYREESLRSGFERALAEIEQMGRLVVLVDDGDALLEHELAPVAARLRNWRRLIITERTPYLPLDCTSMKVISMPALADESLVEILRAAGTLLESPTLFIADLRRVALGDNLELMQVAAQRQVAEGERYHHVLPLADWVDHRLKRTRQSGLGESVDNARKFLRQLAAVRLGVSYEPERKSGVSDADIEMAARPLHLKPGSTQALVDMCVRAGLLLPTQGRWEFMQPGLACFLAAEYLAESDLYGIPSGSRYRQLLNWTAALLAHRGHEGRIHEFFRQVEKSTAGETDLCALDLADLLAEFTGFQSATVSQMRVKVGEVFKRQAQLESNRLRLAIQERASRLGVDVGLANLEGEPEQIVSPESIDQYRRDLPDVLQDLGVPQPGGSEEDWLTDSRVVFALIDHLREDRLVNAQVYAAYWLHHAPLWKIEMTQGRGLLRAERRSAVEGVARIALDPHLDEFRRTLSRGVLATAESLSRLLEYGETCEALVYTILLALDKRLVFREHLRVWKFVE